MVSLFIKFNLTKYALYNTNQKYFIQTNFIISAPKVICVLLLHYKLKKKDIFTMRIGSLFEHLIFYNYISNNIYTLIVIIMKLLYKYT